LIFILGKTALYFTVHTKHDSKILTRGLALRSAHKTLENNFYIWPTSCDQQIDMC